MDVMGNAFEQLLELFLKDELNPEELKSFLAAAKQQDNDRAIKEKILQKLESKAYMGLAGTVDMELKFQQMLQKADRIESNENSSSVIELYPSKKVFQLRRVIIAASVLLVMGLGSYILYLNKPGKSTEFVKTGLPNDVKAPETNRAMITLAGGQRIYLDSVGNGALATQGNVQLVKLADGQIVYNGSANEVAYNTLTNPKGSKVIDMKLADGSHVWLNAGSSITYPVSFVGNERKVSMTGEAYFEVAHDAGKPFYITRGDVEVTVLGTHFNVNAYDDEEDIKVTLLEGSVKTKYEAGSKKYEVILKPGEQASVSEIRDSIREIRDPIRVIRDIDMEQVMAWKNGLFQFKGASITEVLQQASRWYDIQVDYQRPVQKHFSGKLPRSVNLSGLLEILEETGGVKFSIDGKKVSVLK